MFFCVQIYLYDIIKLGDNMKCPECKKELNLKLNKCSNCGYPLDEIKEIEKEVRVLVV